MELSVTLNIACMKFGDILLTSLNKLLTLLISLKWKQVSAVQSKKLYFYIVVSFRHSLSLHNLTYLNKIICITKKHHLK